MVSWGYQIAHQCLQISNTSNQRKWGLKKSNKGKITAHRWHHMTIYNQYEEKHRASHFLRRSIKSVFVKMLHVLLKVKIRAQIWQNIVSVVPKKRQRLVFNSHLKVPSQSILYQSTGEEVLTQSISYLSCCGLSSFHSHVSSFMYLHGMMYFCWVWFLFLVYFYFYSCSVIWSVFGSCACNDLMMDCVTTQQKPAWDQHRLWLLSTLANVRPPLASG